MSNLENNLYAIKHKINSCKQLTEHILGIQQPNISDNVIYKFIPDSPKYFNGIDTIIDTGLPQAAMVDGYTIVARIYPTDYSDNRGLFGIYGMNKDYRGIVGLQFIQSSSETSLKNALTFRHYIDEKEYMIGIPTSKIPLNNYHIVICSYDGGNIGKLYVKDTLISVNEHFAPLVPLDNLIIGKGANNPNRYFKGNISHFIVYNKALNQEEITEIVTEIEGGIL